MNQFETLRQDLHENYGHEYTAAEIDAKLDEVIAKHTKRRNSMNSCRFWWSVRCATTSVLTACTYDLPPVPIMRWPKPQRN